jgi:transposase-like protein
MSQIPSEVSKRTARRPHCSREERQRIVELSFEKGTSITEVARANGVHPSSLSHWRSLYQAEKSTESRSIKNPSPPAFLPVKLTAQTPVPTTSIAHAAVHSDMRTIVQITLPSGATLRIESCVLDIAHISTLLVGMRR